MLDWKRLNVTHPFVNHDVISAESNLAGKSDYLRMEVVYRYGGVYVDTDTIAVNPLDAYGDVFRWPVVSWVKGYNNLFVQPYLISNLGDAGLILVFHALTNLFSQVQLYVWFPEKCTFS